MPTDMSVDLTEVAESPGILGNYRVKCRFQTSGGPPLPPDFTKKTPERLGNKTLRHVDVCDLTVPEPHDRLEHVGLENLLERNRG